MQHSHKVIEQNDGISNWGELLVKACREGDEKSIDKNIKNGGNVFLVDHTKNNLLHITCRGGYLEASKVLISCCPKLKNQVNNDKDTPLKLAIYHGNNPSLVKYLVYQGCLIEPKDQYLEQMGKLNENIDVLTRQKQGLENNLTQQISNLKDDQKSKTNEIQTLRLRVNDLEQQEKSNIAEIEKIKLIPIATLVHDIGLDGVSFSPDGRLIASASEDKTVRLWYV